MLCMVVRYISKQTVLSRNVSGEFLRHSKRLEEIILRPMRTAYIDGPPPYLVLALLLLKHIRVLQVPWWFLIDV